MKKSLKWYAEKIPVGLFLGATGLNAVTLSKYAPLLLLSLGNPQIPSFTAADAFVPKLNHAHHHSLAQLPKPSFDWGENFQELNSDEKDLVKKIAKLLEKNLSAPESVDLAESPFDDNNDLDLSKFFSRPNPDDEVRKLGLDGNERRKISVEQYEHMRNTGRLVIESLDYPGKKHIWEIRFLQNGRENINISFQEATSSALGQIIIEIPKRLSEGPISVKHGVKNLGQGLYDMLDLIIGLPAKVPAYAPHRIGEKVQKKSEQYVLSQMPQSLLAQYRFSNNNQDLNKLIEEVMNDFRAEWDKQFAACREEAMLELEAENSLSPENLRKRLQAKKSAAEIEFLTENEKLENARPGLAGMLIKQKAAAEIIERFEQALSAEVLGYKSEVLKELKAKHPIRSRVPEWINKKVESEAHDFYLKQRQKYYEQKIPATLKENALEEEASIIEFMWKFQCEFESDLHDTLSKEKVPERVFEIGYVRWKEKVEKYVNYLDEASYRLAGDKKLKVDTGHMGWRVKKSLLSVFSHADYGLYWLHLNIWRGPYGIKSLIGRDESFFARKTVDSLNGELIDDEHSKTTTMKGRFLNLRRYIEERNRRFNEAPDKGLISKNTIRPLHRLHLGVIHNLGRVMIGVGQPILTGANVIASAALVATTPVWAPLSELGFWAFKTLVFDYDNPQGGRYLPLINGALTSVAGVGETALATGAGLAGHPVGAGAIYGTGLIGKILYLGWDKVMAELFLKNAFIPTENTMFNVRIHGPGIGSQYYYNVDRIMILLGLSAKLESIHLQNYFKLADRAVNRPLNEYKNFLEKIIAPFGSFRGDSAQYQAIKEYYEAPLEDSNKIAEKRRISTQQILRLPVYNHLVRFAADEDTLKKAGELVEQYCQKISQLDSESVERLFVNYNTVRGDYKELATQLLKDVFSDDLFNKIVEDEDTLVVHIDSQQSFGEFMERLFENP